MTPGMQEAAARLVAARVIQGLPARVIDPVVIATIAGQLRDVPLGNKKTTSSHPSGGLRGGHRAATRNRPGTV